MSWPVGLTATGVGSVSQTDPEHALDWIFHKFPKIPWLPQIRGEKNFVDQWIGHFVSSRVKNNKIHLPLKGTSLIQGVKRHFNSKRRPSPFSDEIGFIPFLKKIETESFLPGQIFKAQCFGPITLSGLICDEDGQPSHTNLEVVQVLSNYVYDLCQQTAHEIYDRGGELLLVIDEPSFSNLNNDSVIVFKELISSLKSKMRVGVHCCGPIPWDFLVDIDLDYLNFDYFLYKEDVLKNICTLVDLINKNTVIALGIIPTHSEQINHEEKMILDHLVDFKKNINQHISINREQFVLTPSCGTSLLNREHEKNVYNKLTQALTYF